MILITFAGTMFRLSTRLFILILIAGASILMAMQDKFLFLIVGSIVSLFLLWDYVSRGTVPLALRKIAINDYPSAEKLLNEIRNFERLTKQCQNQYIMIKGLVEHQKENFKDAKFWLEKGRKLYFHNDNYKAMCLIALCDIALIEKNKREVKTLLSEMDGLQVNKNLSQTVEKIQSYLN